MIRFLRRLVGRRKPSNPAPGLQGEDYEIEKARQEARRRGERFAENLVQKAGRGDNPFVENPFDDGKR